MRPWRLCDVKVAIADGVSLSTDVALPATTGAWPAILIRTPYSKVTGRILEPGKIYELGIEVNDISLELGPAEALEIAVSSSLAPHYHPNPNTGLGYVGSAPPVVVRQAIFHGGQYPSRLVLRVVPVEDAGSQVS
jgi:predicted acyl esterase